MNQIRIIRGYPAILTKDANWMQLAKPKIIPGAVIILPQDAVLVMPPDADIEIVEVVSKHMQAKAIIEHGIGAEFVPDSPNDNPKPSGNA